MHSPGFNKLSRLIFKKTYQINNSSPYAKHFTQNPTIGNQHVTVAIRCADDIIWQNNQSGYHLVKQDLVKISLLLFSVCKSLTNQKILTLHNGEVPYILHWSIMRKKVVRNIVRNIYNVRWLKCAAEKV